jgi:hypothetical protein
MKTTRRKFIIASGALVGIAATGWSKLFRPGAASQAAEATHTLPGFLFLDESAVLPPSVAPTGEIPTMDGRVVTARVSEFTTPQELARDVGFDIYELPTLPSWLTLGSISTVRNSHDQVFSAEINYEAWRMGTTFSAVSVSAREVYWAPVPVRPSRIDGALRSPEVLQVLQTRGVHKVSAIGHIFKWMEHGILYTLRAEYGGEFEEALEFVKNLQRVSV